MYVVRAVACVKKHFLHNGIKRTDVSKLNFWHMLVLSFK